MDKLQLDELYHNLRELCVTDDVFQKAAVEGITSHLTLPQGNYPGLLRFLSYYGEKYILPDVIQLLHSAKHLLCFNRVVELGAGFGWLGRGITNTYGQMPAMYIDKRQYALTDVVADIETDNGSRRVTDELKDGDLIVMSELLHCLDNIPKAVQPFTKWPILVVEYLPSNPHYLRSYLAQIKKFGCKPIGEIHDIFPKSQILTAVTQDTHAIWLILP